MIYTQLETDMLTVLHEMEAAYTPTFWEKIFGRKFNNHLIKHTGGGLCYASNQYAWKNKLWTSKYSEHIEINIDKLLQLMRVAVDGKIKTTSGYWYPAGELKRRLILIKMAINEIRFFGYERD